MLDNQNGSNEASILSAFESHLSDAEPQEPTEEVAEIELSEAEEVEEQAEPETLEVEYEAEQSEVEEVEEVEEAAYEVVIDGQTQEVTLNELLSGYQRQADYTRKTQSVAEDRKQVENDLAQIKTLTEGLEASSKQLQELLAESESAVDWGYLIENDTSEYLKQKELQEKRAKALQEAQSQQDRLKQMRVAEETQKLYQKVSTWADPKQRERDIEMVNSYLGDIGYSQGEFQQTDHRLILALMDAAKYRELKGKTASVEKKIKKVPKVTKPGAKLTKAELSQKERDQKRQRFRKTGDEQDGIEVFKQFV